VRAIYESGDEQLTRALLRKYRIRYVVVGDLERQQYRALNVQKLRHVGAAGAILPNAEVIVIPNRETGLNRW
jgi:hypothetical protein